jgi:hypothetical protein
MALARPALLKGQMVQKTDGGESFGHRRLDVLLHGAGGVVAKAGMDVVVDHGLQFRKKSDICVTLYPSSLRSTEWYASFLGIRKP